MPTSNVEKKPRKRPVKADTLPPYLSASEQVEFSPVRTPERKRKPKKDTLEDPDERTPEGLALEQEPADDFDPTADLDDIGLREIIGDPKGKSFDEITNTLDQMKKHREIVETEEGGEHVPTLADQEMEQLDNYRSRKEMLEDIRQEKGNRFKTDRELEIVRLQNELKALHEGTEHLPLDNFEDKQREEAHKEKNPYRNDPKLGFAERNIDDSKKSGSFFSRLGKWFNPKEKAEQRNPRKIDDFLDLQNRTDESERTERFAAIDEEQAALEAAEKKEKYDRDRLDAMTKVYEFEQSAKAKKKQDPGVSEKDYRTWAESLDHESVNHSYEIEPHHERPLPHIEKKSDGQMDRAA